MARRKSQSSQKRRVDPHAPKKSKSAWIMFASDNREDVKKQNPNLKGVEITKKLGEMWRQSDDATKRRYQKQSQAGQEEYDEKLAAYKEEKKQKSQSSNSKKNSGQTSKETNNTGETNNTEETNDYDDPM